MVGELRWHARGRGFESLRLHFINHLYITTYNFMRQVEITKNRLLRQNCVTVIPALSPTPVPPVSEVSARLEIFDGFNRGSYW